MKKLLFIGIALSFYSLANAQSFVDNALLFSRTNPGGSARIQALGGTQISLGGDYSSSRSNPAGLGMYNRSEFTLSPGYFMNTTQASYAGTSTDRTASSVNIPGISYVLNHRTNSETGFLGGSLGISFVRTNDLHSNYSYGAQSSSSSLLDYFLNDAYNYQPNQMLSGGSDYYNLTALAYNNYLIEDFTDNNGDLAYGSVLSTDPDKPGEVRSVLQNETLERKGAQNQWSISYGANFNDKLFIGAGLGITTLRYNLNVHFKESNFQYSESPSYNPIISYDTDETYDIKGSGVNFTAGLIYRPINFFQLGASIVTPTLYQLNDSYTAGVTSQWNNYDYYDDGTKILNEVFEGFDSPLISQYTLKTPMKFSTGATFISKIGFISTDIELVNYSKAKYRSNQNGLDFQYDNEDIQSDYTSVINYRMGAEYRYDMFRVRGGFRYMADPYRSQKIDRSITAFSGGLGIKKESFFVDLAATLSQTKDRRIPYFPPSNSVPVPIASLDVRTMNYIVTVGFTF